MKKLTNFRRPFSASIKNPEKFAILSNTGEVEVLIYLKKKEFIRKNILDMGLKSAKCIHLNNDDQIIILDDVLKKVVWFDLSFKYLGELNFHSNEISNFKYCLYDKNLYLILKDTKEVISFDERLNRTPKAVLNFSKFPDLYSSTKVLRIANDRFLFLDSKNVFLHYVESDDKKIKSCKNFLKKGRSGKGFARNPTDINLLNDYIVLHDNDNYLLQFFDLNLDFKYQVGGKGDSKDRFDLPVSGCVSKNTLFVCDQNNDRIVKLKQISDGCIEFLKDEFVPGNLCRPSGIAYRNELVFVADRSNSRIQIFDRRLKFLGLLETNEILHRPSSIAFLDNKSEPTIAVIERRDGANALLSLYKINKDFHAKKLDFKLDSRLSLKDPQDLQSDSKGKMYIADTLNRKLLKVNKSGALECSANLSEISNNPRVLIKCVNIRSSDNHIFTADFDRKIIYEFDESLDYLSSIDLSKEKKVTCIRSIFTTPQYILVTTRGEHEVIKVNYEGKIIGTLGLENISSYSWNHPVKICQGNDQETYFADKENDRIILFNSDLKAITLSRNI